MKEITTNNLTIGVGKQVILFSASWCEACPAVTSQLEMIEKKYPNYDFMKSNVCVDSNPSDFYNVRGLPTIIVLDGKEEIYRFTGSTAAGNLAKWLLTQG